MDFLKKIGEVKNKLEEVKKRLDAVMFEGRSADGKIRIEISGNRELKNIFIDDALLDPGTKDIMNSGLKQAFTEAMKQAEKVNEAEMKAAGKGLLPGFPGLF